MNMTWKEKDGKFRSPPLPPSCPGIYCVSRCHFMMWDFREVSLMMGDKMQLSRSFTSRSLVSPKIKYFTKRLKTVGADSETRRGEWGLRFANERLALSAALCQYGAHCRHLEQNWRTSIIGVDKRTAGAPLGDIWFLSSLGPRWSRINPRVIGGYRWHWATFILRGQYWHLKYVLINFDNNCEQW